MEAGADFIKTSTGKITENATPRALLVMCDAINMFEKAHQKKIGVKPAGGLSEISTASLFVNIVLKTLGKTWFDKQLFRLGTSRFSDVLIKKIV
jgi:deoxyribose-phosphate aldolase